MGWVVTAKVIEPEANKILKQMSNYLSVTQQFEVTALATIESMLDSGQKIMMHHNVKILVRSPNKLYVTRTGDTGEKSLYYDGKSLTLYSAPHHYYARVDDAPADLSEALDMANARFDIITPGAVLIYENNYARLSNGLLSGFYVGKSIIDSVECHHLAFRNTEVDWQIWIQTGDNPLPKRYVITSRWTTGSPQYSLLMDWEVKPAFSDDVFNFVVPKQAEKIQLLDKSHTMK